MSIANIILVLLIIYSVTVTVLWLRKHKPYERLLQPGKKTPEWDLGTFAKMFRRDLQP